MSPAKSRLLALLLGLVAAGVVLALVVPRLLEPRGATVQVLDTSHNIDELQDYLERHPDAVLGAPRGNLGHLLLTREICDQVFGARAGTLTYDPLSYTRRRGLVDYDRVLREHPDGKIHVRTNSLGLREDKELSRERPWRRILVVGDSHTDGVCNNDESYANRLEALLDAEYPGGVFEVLNAGCGGHSFYNYLGSMERYEEFGLHAVIVGVYGGNDFYELMGPAQVFAGKRRLRWGALRAQLNEATRESAPALSQALRSAAYFKVHPKLIEPCAGLSARVLIEMGRRLERDGGQLIVAYIPPVTESQPELYEAELEAAIEVLELTPEEVLVSARLADAVLARVRGAGIEVLDLREEFAEAGTPLYWHEDLHINLDAQQRIAERLLPLVEVREHRVPAVR